MQRSSEPKARPRLGRALALATALLSAVALGQPSPAYAGPHGGGGFRGGGFHGSGGVHEGGSAGWHQGYGGWHYGYGGWGPGFGAGVGVGLGLGYLSYPYGWSGYAPDYGWDYGYGQAYPTQTWYYCSDPAGYYPYVTQCNAGWQAVPAV
jgi:hypothetical protein